MATKVLVIARVLVVEFCALALIVALVEGQAAVMAEGEHSSVRRLIMPLRAIHVAIRIKFIVNKSR